MSVTPTHCAPAQIVAGDSIDFLVAIPSELSGWTGSARLTGAGQMTATSVTVVGSDLRVKFDGQGDAGTKALTAGQYTLTVWATNGNDRYTIGQYRLTVKPDLATGTPALEHAIKMLGLIEGALENRLSQTPDGGVEEWMINGRQVKKLSTSALTALRNRYAAEVQALQNPGQLRRIQAVFTPAGFAPRRTRPF